MDPERQKPSTLARRWSDSVISMGPRNTNPTKSTTEAEKNKAEHWAQAKEKALAIGKDTNNTKDTGNEDAVSLEPPSPLKNRPWSLRLSVDVFRLLNLDGDLREQRKRSSMAVSLSDTTSISTFTSGGTLDRHLSNKMKKAWRGMKGQRQVDPLHQWMVEHSGGTLRDHAQRKKPAE